MSRSGEPAPDPPRQTLVIKSRRSRTPPATSKKNLDCSATILALLSLVVFWLVCFVLLMTLSSSSSINNNYDNGIRAISSIHNVLANYRSGLRKQQHRSQQQQQQQKHPRSVAQPSTPMAQQQEERIIGAPQQHHQRKHHQQPHIVSRFPNKVVATADVRGNLGPASVVVQAKPGTDWIHDRWQAASNMHGKQIPGEHWIQLEFENTDVVADRIVLDWETAYADEYVLEASSTSFTADENHNPSGKDNSIRVLFDGRKPADVATMRSVTTSGKSPGVDKPMPLHVVHEIKLSSSVSRNKAFRFLRLHILKSVTGWGVSLWQFDVYGYRTDEVQSAR